MQWRPAGGGGGGGGGAIYSKLACCLQLLAVGKSQLTHPIICLQAGHHSSLGATALDGSGTEVCLH